MRVLHVLKELRASGAEVMLATAGGLWGRHDVTCDVLSTGPVPGSFRSVLREAGYRIHHVPFTGDVAFLRAYVHLIRSEGYDVVHVHAEQASFYLCLAARLAGAGVVRTTHNSFPYSGALQRRRTWQRRVTRAVGTVYVAIGETVAENEWQRLRNPTTRVDNWVDIETFAPPTQDERRSAREALEVGDGDVVVVTVGHCSPVKNHTSLLESLARIDDLPWVWLHVGEEQEGRPEHDLARERHVQQRCRFLGRTEPLQALHAADVYAMPSLYEGLPISVLEALATGLPTVLTDVPGNRDLRGVAERMVWSSPDADGVEVALREALTASIEPVSDDARHRQHEAVAARYSPAVGVASYVNVYRSRVAGRGDRERRVDDP